MGILAIGLSHRTAPVEVRERVAVADGEVDAASQRARALSDSGEAMLVSTCNRVELYLDTSDEAGARERVADFLVEIGAGHATSAVAAPAIDRAALLPHLYAHSGAAAARHLFRVAASLDSAVVGEPQILGQVKEAYERAQRAGTIGPRLGRLVPRAFAAAKRVRTETGIARASSSVASAAVDLGRRIFGDLKGREVLIVGAGKMGDLAARHLVSAGCARLLIVNRTLARAESLAAELAAETGGKTATEAHSLDALPSLLVRADIVLCSTGAARPILGRDVVQRAMKARKGRWLCLLDIAVPRDVEPEVAEIENVYLYDVDHLTHLTDENLAERRREAEAGERILVEELLRWERSESALGVVPTIKMLREHFGAVAAAEVQRSMARWKNASEKDQRELQLLADAIINKLLHAPLTRLKREAESESLVAAVHSLFDLGVPTEGAKAPPAVKGAGESPSESLGRAAAGPAEDASSSTSRAVIAKEKLG